MGGFSRPLRPVEPFDCDCNSVTATEANPALTRQPSGVGCIRNRIIQQHFTTICIIAIGVLSRGVLFSELRNEQGFVVGLNLMLGRCWVGLSGMPAQIW